MLLTSPLAKGLFHKAIIESGGGRDGLFPTRYPQDRGPRRQPVGGRRRRRVRESQRHCRRRRGSAGGAARAARREGRGGPQHGDDDDADLRRADGGRRPHGRIGGDRAARRALREGPGDRRRQRTPTSASRSPRTIDDVFKPFGDQAAKAREAYDPAKTDKVREVGTLVAMDRMMVEPARFIVRTVAAAGQPAYHYRFSYVAESMRKQWPGAPHATEIPYVFDTVRGALRQGSRAGRQGDRRGRERLLGGVREDRRSERRRASGVARVQGRVRRAARLHEGRAEGRAGPVDGAPRSDGGRRGQGALIGRPKGKRPTSGSA